MECPVSKAIETGMPCQAELTPENQPHWPADQGSWAVNAASVKDAAGNIVGAIEIEKRAAHIISLDEQYRSFGETLHRLAKGFEEKKIQSLVERFMLKGDER